MPFINVDANRNSWSPIKLGKTKEINLKPYYNKVYKGNIMDVINIIKNKLFRTFIYILM